LQTALSFVAPASAKKLYLAGDHRAMPWVYLERLIPARRLPTPK
jgi:hypothetical protein